MTEVEEKRYAAMVEFLGSFPSISVPPKDLSDLDDGVALTEALSQISPEHFDSSTISRNLGSNWALKSSNIRKLIRNLETFFHTVLEKTTDFDSLNESVSKIARSSDKPAIASIVELIIAASISCDDRGTYVGYITNNMSESAQAEMKTIIQTSMVLLEEYDDEVGSEDEDEFDDDSGIEFDDSDDDAQISEDVRGMFNESMAQFDSVLVGMDGSISGGSQNSGSSFSGSKTDVNKERDELRTTLQDTRRELAALKSHSSISSEEQENAQNKLRDLAEDLQERLGARQEELGTLEIQLATKTRELEDIESKMLDLKEKNTSLADELDVANAKALQLRKTEATLTLYRKKLEDVGAMNQQMTDLEDQSANYLKQIMDLEMETKKVPELLKSVDELKKSLTVTERERLEATEKADVKITEIAKMKATLSAMESTQKMYEDELEALRSSQNDGGVELESPMNGLSLTSAKSASAMKEKVMRLEFENDALKRKIENQSSTALAIEPGLTTQTTGGDVAMIKEIAQLKVSLKRKEAEKKKIGSDKEKLEAYTKKTLSKFQEKYLVALQDCKTKLREKHVKIETLEKRSLAEKAAQKREERLLSSTIYELGLTIMQQRLKER